jgi:hypothetical protein
MERQMKSTDKNRVKILKQARNVKNIPVLVGIKQEPSGKEKQPLVRLIHTGEKDARIEVQCSCGKRILLECDYE